MHALLIAKGVNDPSTRYRVYPIAARLREQEWDVSVLYSSGFMNRVRLLKKAKIADIVVIQRKLFGRIFLTLLNYFCRNIIFDFDDAIFVSSDGSDSVLRHRRFIRLLKSCSMVWAGNSYLAEHARQYCQNTHVIPTSIDPDRYSVTEEKEEKFTLVWIGSSSTSRYLKAHTELLNSIGKSFEGIKLRIIGDFEFNLDHLEIENIAWQEDTEVNLLATSHVGVAPMSDDAWTKGKCALKVLQYMATGLPVISSDVGANRDVIDESITGYLADTTDQWIESIKVLMEDDDLRSTMGRAARRKIKDEFDIESVLDKQVNTLQKLCG